MQQSQQFAASRVINEANERDIWQAMFPEFETFEGYMAARTTRLIQHYQFEREYRPAMPRWRALQHAWHLRRAGRQTTTGRK